MSIDERMTICNMSIEGGARAGYVNPDDTTFAYLKGRQFAPSGAAWDKAVAWWRSMASDKNATYDDRVVLDAASIEPTVTWGINPGQSVGVSERIPANADPEALAYMGFRRESADPRHEDRRRLHRLVHERADLGHRRSREDREGPQGREARESADGAGLARSRPKPRSAGCTRSSSTPASNGAAPAARCASR